MAGEYDTQNEIKAGHKKTDRTVSYTYSKETSKKYVDAQQNAQEIQMGI